MLALAQSVCKRRTVCPHPMFACTQARPLQYCCFKCSRPPAFVHWRHHHTLRVRIEVRCPTPLPPQAELTQRHYAWSKANISHIWHVPYLVLLHYLVRNDRVMWQGHIQELCDQRLMGFAAIYNYVRRRKCRMMTRVAPLTVVATFDIRCFDDRCHII